MLKDNIVSKANDLNLRAYQLSRTEQLLVLTIASLVQPTDEDFKTYTLYIKDFLELLGVSDQSKYIELPKLTRGLMTKVIEIKKPHSLLQVAWFSSAEHKPGEGVIEIEFSPKLKPYLLNLKENFVSYALQHVSKLVSKYSIRIYELLKQYQFKKSVTFEMNEFRDLIGLDDSIYPRYSNMKPKILLNSQKELSEKTDISFDFEEIKTGRKVTDLKFYIKSNTRASVKPKVSSQEEVSVTEIEEDTLTEKDINIQKVIEIFRNHDINKLEALKVLEAAQGDIDNIQKCYEYCLTQNVDDMVPYMLSIVKPGAFSKPKSNRTSKDPKGRQRTHEEVEDLKKKLLGWDHRSDNDGQEYEQGRMA